jgi:hypothetical protein
MSLTLKSAQLQACVVDCIAVTPSARRERSIETLRSFLRAEIAVWSRDEVRAGLLPLVAQAHNCPVVAGRQKAYGRSVLDSGAVEYEATKKALQRLVNAVLRGGRPTQSKPQQKSIDQEIKSDVDALLKKYKDELSSRSVLRIQLRKALESL